MNSLQKMSPSIFVTLEAEREPSPLASPSLTNPYIDPPAERRKRKRTFTNVDESISDFLEAKRKKIKQENEVTHVKTYFLVSLIPGIHSLIEHQMRTFRRSVFQLIDSIRGDESVLQVVQYSSATGGSF